MGGSITSRATAGGSISCGVYDVPLKVPSALKPVAAEAAGLRRLVGRGGITRVHERAPRSSWLMRSWMEESRDARATRWNR